MPGPLTRAKNDEQITKSAEIICIWSSERYQGDPDHRFAYTSVWSRNFFDTNIVRSVKNVRPHGGSRGFQMDQTAAVSPGCDRRHCFIAATSLVTETGFERHMAAPLA